MNRFIKGCAVLLAWSFLLSVAHAGNVAAKGSKNKEPAPQSKETESKEGAGELQFPETVYDFGEVAEGAEVEHDFIVKNVGKTEVQIEQVRPG